MREPAQDIVAGRRARYRQAGETRRGGLPAASPSSSPSWQAFALAVLRASTRPHDHQRRRAAYP